MSTAGRCSAVNNWTHIPLAPVEQRKEVWALLAKTNLPQIKKSLEMLTVQQTKQCGYCLGWWYKSGEDEEFTKAENCSVSSAEVLPFGRMLRWQIGQDFLDRWPLVCRFIASSGPEICHQGPPNSHFCGCIWSAGASCVPASDKAAIPDDEGIYLLFHSKSHRVPLHCSGTRCDTL